MNVTALEVPGAGGTTLKTYLLFPLRLIFLAGAEEVPSVGDDKGVCDTAVTHRCAVISITPLSLAS